MKKILFFLFMICSVGTQALPTEDYMYATELKFDDNLKLDYFDVCLKGQTKYTAYGVDIQLPVGLEVYNVDNNIGILMLKNGIYPSDMFQNYSHSVSASCPNAQDLTHVRVACISTSNALLTSSSGALFRVYVNRTYKEGDWPLGVIRLYAVELNVVGQAYQAKDKESIVLVHSGETSLPFNISAAGWSTLLLPFDAEIPEGVEVYEVQSRSTDKVYLSAVDKLSAYTPYIVHKADAYNTTLTGTVEAKCPESGIVNANGLCGAVITQQVTAGYVLQNLNEGVKFYPIQSGTFNIPAGKCWIDNSVMGVKGLQFVFDDEEDSLNRIVRGSSDKRVYDLSGRKLDNMGSKGVYIINGKKTIK